MMVNYPSHELAIDKAIAARHGETKEQGIGNANGKSGESSMKLQPAYSPPFALSAPRCMASLAQVITHIHQCRSQTKKHPARSKLKRL